MTNTRRREHALVFFVSDGYGGYGDFLYALKVIAGIQRRLAAMGYGEKIYLVTQSTGKEKIKLLKGDEEFNVEVLSTEEFLAKNLKLDCFIEGPVFNPCTHSNLRIPDDTPVLLLPEYSIPEAAEAAERALLLNNQNRVVKIIYSGLYSDSNKKLDEKKSGILLTEELREVAAKKEQNNFNFRENYWAEIKPKHVESIRPNNQSVSDYHQNTELSFVYNNDTNEGLQFQTAQTQHQHFLWVHQLFTQTAKNQDIVSIGKLAQLRKDALQKMLPMLIQNGYTHISFTDLDTGTETVYHKNQEVPGAPTPDSKRYRLLHATELTHRQMIAMLALCGDLVGATGDQTFSEAFGKIIVYECFSHKKEFAEAFYTSLWAVYPHHAHDEIMSAVKAMKLGEKLLRSNVETATPREVEVLKTLLRNPDALMGYKNACKKIAEKCNLIEVICSNLEEILKPQMAAKLQALYPFELTKDQISSYQRLLAEIKESDVPGDILKLSRQDDQLDAEQLPFSVLKYPNDKGFYLLDHGEGAVLGEGDWGRVKQGYYCDENGNINPEPIAIKIEKTSDIAKVASELGMFKSVHSHEEDKAHLYKQGQRDDNSNKAYSMLPKIPGVALNVYLKQNPNLSMNERLAIAKAVMDALTKAHNKQVAHLDLFANNVHYDSSTGQAFLIDFGRSHSFGAEIEVGEYVHSEHMPPEYYSKIKVDGSFDVYSSVLLIMQILDGSLTSLMATKLENALPFIQNADIRLEIRSAVEDLSANKIFGEILHSLSDCPDPGLNEFTQQFNASGFNFNELKQLISEPGIASQLIDTLVKMSDPDPVKRMSAGEAASKIEALLLKLKPAEGSEHQVTIHRLLGGK